MRFFSTFTGIGGFRSRPRAGWLALRRPMRDRTVLQRRAPEALAERLETPEC